MKIQKIKEFPPTPVDMLGSKKTAMRTQFAALCYRMRKGLPEVLLVTSRRTRRWIIPKGWPNHGMTPAQSAALEALEEAGVEGRIYEVSIGLYTYAKQNASGNDIPCAVSVFPLKVKTVHSTYLEKKQRRRKWMPPHKAAKLVQEPELAHLLRDFDPRRFSKV